MPGSGDPIQPLHDLLALAPLVVNFLRDSGPLENHQTTSSSQANSVVGIAPANGQALGLALGVAKLPAQDLTEEEFMERTQAVPSAEQVGPDLPPVHVGVIGNPAIDDRAEACSGRMVQPQR